MAISKQDADHETHAGLTIRYLYDQDAQSPREDDNLGTIATWHRRYTLGDVQPKETPSEYLAGLPKGSIVIPVYMYEHGGIALSTGRGGQFSDPWDSGQLGVISISPEKIRAEYSVKRITAKLRERVTGYLKSEIEYYSMYLEGQCYGYIIEDADGETLDSCWGFIGHDYVREEARSQAEYFAAQRGHKATIRNEAGL